MNYLKTLRQTGRTTRMLLMALELAHHGRAVYVVAVNVQHANAMANILRNLEPGWAGLGIKFELSSKIGTQLDWQRRELRGGRPNCAVLIDHATWEHHWGWVLEGAHQFDAEPKAEPTAEPIEQPQMRPLDLQPLGPAPEGLRWRVADFYIERLGLGKGRAVARLQPIWEPGFVGEIPAHKNVSYPLEHPGAHLLERCSITKESIELRQLGIPLP